jgi:hypothetical protein
MNAVAAILAVGLTLSAALGWYVASRAIGIADRALSLAREILNGEEGEECLMCELEDHEGVEDG